MGYDFYYNPPDPPKRKRKRKKPSAVPTDALARVRERVQRFETGRNGDDDSFYVAATDRTFLLGRLDDERVLRQAKRPIQAAEAALDTRWPSADERTGDSVPPSAASARKATT